MLFLIFLLSCTLASASKNIEQEIAYYESIISQHPGNAHAHLQVAQLYLTKGKFIEGWQELEWHLGYKPEFTRNAQKYFQTHQSLQGKIILLTAEWGAGDTIWLTRYAQLLKTRGAHVIIHVMHNSLIPLFKQQPYFDEILPRESTNIPCHFEIPMMSLPMVFNTTVENIPADIPYIQIYQKLVDMWKEKLNSDKNFKIGICWHGNTIHGEEKFMPLSYFAQLASARHSSSNDDGHIPNISIYSLQQHHGLDQLDKLENEGVIKTFDADFDSIPFLDTAAVIKNLDLVITVDTSIAHLAGALGVPVWVILPTSADWRWMLDRDDSPWYPTMKLFRQHSGWQKVIDEIKSALKN